MTWAKEMFEINNNKTLLKKTDTNAKYTRLLRLENTLDGRNTMELWYIALTKEILESPW